MPLNDPSEGRHGRRARDGLKHRKWEPVAILLSTFLVAGACSSGTGPEEGFLFWAVIVYGSVYDDQAAPVSGAEVVWRVFHGPCGASPAPEVRDTTFTNASGDYRSELVSMDPDLIACLAGRATHPLGVESGVGSVELGGIQFKGEAPDSLEVHLGLHPGG